MILFRTTHWRRFVSALATVVALGPLAVTPPALADGATPNPTETIDTSPTATDLAQSLVGDGVSVSNVTFTGDPAGRGRFDFSDPTVVGFDQGLVMSSGAAADVVGPNVSDWTSTDFTRPGDADLSGLSGYPTYDAAVLEFDFTPVTNQVVFSYAFASDEYPEYVNTVFNDVFAFFVNGTNCAEVRQTAGDPSSPSVPVTVNNINNSNPVQDPLPAPVRPDLFRANYQDPAGASALDLEFDGITSVLTCQSAVVPDAPNHMKLAIADSSDGIYDAAVFIQAGSLVSNDNPVADLSLLPSTGPAPLTVQAIVEAEDPDGDALTYTIDWGDGSPESSGPLPGDTALVDHVYTSSGEFLVTLTVSNGTLSGTSVEDVDVTGSAPPPPPPPPPPPDPDTTPPTLAPAFSSPPPFLVGATGVTASANASDDASGIASESCEPVDTATAGLKSITCSALDGAGNSATAYLTYVVGYQALNVKPAAGAKYKRTAGIPVSFKLAGAAGVISDAAAALLRPSVSVAFGALPPVTPSYSKKTDSFTTTLSTGKPPTGSYTVVIRVTVGGTDLTTVTIPVTIA